MNAQRDPRPGTDPPILRKLRGCFALSGTEADDLRSLGAGARHSPVRATLVAEGQTDGSAVLIHEGWAMRHRTLRDGRRQILDFAVPGDLCDPSSFVTLRTDFSITCITPVRWSLVQAADLLALVSRSPRLGAVLWWLEAQEELLLRAHLVAVGRLTAVERVAYLIWELWNRLRQVGLVAGDSFEFPATQEMLADATGLSHVHVSRMLNRLEREGIIRREDHRYRLLDVAALMRMAQVDATHEARPFPRRVEELLVAG